MNRDPFKGSDADLIDSINALIGLNAAGALTPRIPGMAITLLTSAAIRFAPGPGAPSKEPVAA